MHGGGGFFFFFLPRPPVDGGQGEARQAHGQPGTLSCRVVSCGYFLVEMAFQRPVRNEHPRKPPGASAETPGCIRGNPRVHPRKPPSCLRPVASSASMFLPCVFWLKLFGTQLV